MCACVRGGCSMLITGEAEVGVGQHVEQEGGERGGDNETGEGSSLLKARWMASWWGGRGSMWLKQGGARRRGSYWADPSLSTPPIFPPSLLRTWFIRRGSCYVSTQHILLQAAPSLLRTRSIRCGGCCLSTYCCRLPPPPPTDHVHQVWWQLPQHVLLQAAPPPPN